MSKIKYRFILHIIYIHRVVQMICDCWLHVQLEFTTSFTFKWFVTVGYVFNWSLQQALLSNDLWLLVMCSIGVCNKLYFQMICDCWLCVQLEFATSFTFKWFVTVGCVFNWSLQQALLSNDLWLLVVRSIGVCNKLYFQMICGCGLSVQLEFATSFTFKWFVTVGCAFNWSSQQALLSNYLWLWVVHSIGVCNKLYFQMICDCGLCVQLEFATSFTFKWFVTVGCAFNWSLQQALLSNDLWLWVLRSIGVCNKLYFKMICDCGLCIQLEFATSFTFKWFVTVQGPN